MQPVLSCPACGQQFPSPNAPGAYACNRCGQRIEFGTVQSEPPTTKAPSRIVYGGAERRRRTVWHWIPAAILPVGLGLFLFALMLNHKYFHTKLDDYDLATRGASYACVLCAAAMVPAFIVSMIGAGLRWECIVPVVGSVLFAFLSPANYLFGLAVPLLCTVGAIALTRGSPEPVSSQ